MSEAVRWGILSTANINEKVLAGVSGSPAVEVAAVGSRSRESAERFAAAHDIPRAHGSSFESSTGQELRGAADALRTILRKIDVALEKPAYNLYLHTMPLREAANDWYHWHLELKPVLTQQAGFEWASGCSMNPTPPEEAASFLRQTEV